MNEWVSASRESYWSLTSVRLACPASMSWFLLYLTIFYFVMYGCYVLETCSFLMRGRNGAVSEETIGEEEVGGVQRGETVNR